MLILIITTPINFRVCSHNSDKHVHKIHNFNNQFNKVTGETQMLRSTNSEAKDTINHLNSNSPSSSFDSA